MSESTSMVNPAAHIAASVASIDAGIEIAAIAALRQAWRNNEHDEHRQHRAFTERLQYAGDRRVGLRCVGAQRLEANERLVCRQPRNVL